MPSPTKNPISNEDPDPSIRSLPTVSIDFNPPDEEEGVDKQSIYSVVSEDDMLEKTGKAAVRSMKYVVGKAIKMTDVYNVENKPSTVAGGVVTMFILPLAIFYAVFLLYTLWDEPLALNNELVWTSQYHPFPINLRCVSPDGCFISNNNKDNTPIACSFVSNGDEIVADFNFFNSPKTGLSVLTKAGEEFESTIAARSETYMHESVMADSKGTLVKWDEYASGTIALNMVYTHNQTLTGSGEFRREYFGLQADFNPSPITGSFGDCDTSELWDPTESVQTRIRIQASSNLISVTSPLTLVVWFGSASGSFEFLFSWGGLILIAIEYVLSKLGCLTTK